MLKSLISGFFSTLCDNFCLWNREMFTEKDFWDYFSEETIIIDLVSTQKPEEPISKGLSVPHRCENRYSALGGSLAKVLQSLNSSSLMG